MIFRYLTDPSRYIVPVSIVAVVLIVVLWRVPPTRDAFVRFGGAVLGRLLGAATGAASIASPMDNDDIEERRFRVTDPHGQSHDCLLVGELVGGAIKRGDDVLIWGRRDRRKIVRVRKLQIVASGASLTGRTPGSVWLRRANRYLIVLIVIAAALLLLVWGVGR